jgi:hypothetical protein
MRRFRTLFVVSIAVASGFCIGKFVQLRSQAHIEFALPGVEQRYTVPIAPGVAYSCRSVTEVATFVNRFNMTANADSGAGTGKLALKIASDGKGIFRLTDTAVGLGVTDAGEAVPIVHSSSDYIVAVKIDVFGAETLIMDTKTRNVVWSRTNSIFGINGYSAVLSCR